MRAAGWSASIVDARQTTKDVQRWWNQCAGTYMYIHPTPAVYLTKLPTASVLRRGNQQGPPVMTPKASYERAQAATQMCRAMIEAQSTKHT